MSQTTEKKTGKIDFILKFNKNAIDSGLTVRDAIGLCAIASATADKTECDSKEIYQITGDRGMPATLRWLKQHVDFRQLESKSHEAKLMYKLTPHGIDTVMKLLSA